jgi:pyrimidine-nucleoside phosphorylase
MKNSALTAYQLIDKKKRGEKLSYPEIKHFIDNLVAGTFQDYQASAFLMAIYFQGLNREESYHLTKSMVESGRYIKFKGNQYVDKHSTGGIGDKTTFIIAPIAAQLGVKVPMIAGRGLGFTGGTVDKMESIPGLSTSLKIEDFKKHVTKYGLSMMGQTEEIAPADRILYSLRDVTATIDSIPLITSSILSKKIAEGSNALVMDIKIGSGSFMQTLPRAVALSKSIKQVMHQYGKACTCVISDMSQPLGNNVGNSLEIIESIETLKGQGPKDLTDLSIELAAHMVLLAKKAKTISEARKKCSQALYSGQALEKFYQLIERQNGDTRACKDYTRLPLAKKKTQIKAPKNGYIASFMNQDFGYFLTDLGGGRKQRGDQIDTSVGFVFHKKLGDSVKKGEPILTAYHHENQRTLINKIRKKCLEQSITIKTRRPQVPPLIAKTIR